MWDRGSQKRQKVPVAHGPEGWDAWRAPALFCYLLLTAPTEWSLAAWTDHQPPQHVHYERYDDKDEEYLYRSQAHSHIMHRPELLRKPLVSEKGALIEVYLHFLWRESPNATA
jgi:hypothetical protein